MSCLGVGRVGRCPHSRDVVGEMRTIERMAVMYTMHRIVGYLIVKIIFLFYFRVSFEGRCGEPFILS